MAKIYEGAIGLVISADAGEPLVGATDRTIEMQSPLGLKKSFPATINGNTLEYTTLSADDLDEAGDWLVQPEYTLSGWTSRGETALMKVHAFFK